MVTEWGMVLYRLFVLITFDLKSDEVKEEPVKWVWVGEGDCEQREHRQGGISQDLEDQGAGVQQEAVRD